MRSYNQYCAVAKALDAIGDRWSLLIVRELMTRGACRYKDLKDDLPGIATNVLAERLRHLEEVGVVSRQPPTPPVATDLYVLTKRGEDLLPVLRELGRWGGQFMGNPREGDVFFAHWLLMPAELHLVDHRPDDPPVCIELRTGDQAVTVDAEGGSIKVSPRKAAAPDAVVEASPALMLGVLVGKTTLDEAKAAGLKVHGDLSAVQRVMTS